MKINKEQHKEQLTIGDLKKLIIACTKIFGKDVDNIPVYIGDDDELNGIHCAWCIDYIPVAENDKEGWREIIEENCTCIPLGDDEVAILIS